MQYRRVLVPGTTYFFTLNLANRNSKLLTDEIVKLKSAFNKVRKIHPYKIDAIVIMPDHLHAILTLPQGDADYSQRWNLIKGNFSRQIHTIGYISTPRRKKREREIWQRRFWEHMIRNDLDYERHVNYIHYNPVKHGYVDNPADWPFSSIHQYIAEGILPIRWCADFPEQGCGEA